MMLNVKTLKKFRPKIGLKMYKKGINESNLTFRALWLGFRKNTKKTFYLFYLVQQKYIILIEVE